MKRVMEFPELEIRIAGQESATRLKDKQLLQMLVFFRHQQRCDYVIPRCTAVKAK